MFTNDTLAFLGELADNNDRDWFTANKKRYEQHVKAPALAFIEAFAPRLHGISPHFLAIPKAQGGSLFRIYRDTRFSKDKTPYKTHVGVQFRHEDASRDVHAPGWYVGVEPGNSAVGVGMWKPSAPALRAVRDQIVAEPERWAEVRSGLAEAGMTFMDDDMLKRAPKGFDPDHRHIEDLRRKTFAVKGPFSDEVAIGPDLADTVEQAYRSCAPLVRFLCDSQGVAF